MWKAIKVYGINYSWCVQHGALRVYDEDDTTSAHEWRFYSVYRYVDKNNAHSRLHVADDITQQEAGRYIRKALRTDTNYTLIYDARNGINRGNG